jgi:two-component system response regulator VicR
MKAHLLYVEDDESLGFVTRDHLELQGYVVTHCADGHDALQVLQTQTFDLCLLDVMLPGIDGFSLAKEIRKTNTEVPILFLTAKSLKEDKIQGFRLGADDFITKPFSIEELILRIEVFLRRRKIGEVPSHYIPLGNCHFDHTKLELNCMGNIRRLTQREADLLLFLWKNRNQIVRRSTILENIWGEDDYFLGRSLDVFISRLRKYVKEDVSVKIENIHGIGFCLQINSEP